MMPTTSLSLAFFTDSMNLGSDLSSITAAFRSSIVKSFIPSIFAMTVGSTPNFELAADFNAFIVWDEEGGCVCLFEVREYYEIEI